MRVIIVYDSLHGNTQKIAEAMGAAIGADAAVHRVGSLDNSDMLSADIVVVGSPTHGGRPTPAVQEMLSRLTGLKGKRAAAFDTRLGGRMVKLFGYAAPRAHDLLKEKGAAMVAPPEGFVVMKTVGPLRDGEIERAAAWAKALVSAAGL